jgi:signal transduction histidine kinase
VTELRDILVVDDDPLDREMVRRLLPATVAVREAGTAAEARAELARAVPDLVVLDHRLPDVDGVDLVPLFAERSVPVVMLTGVEAPETIVMAIQRGGGDYLVKGALTRDGLARALRNVLEKAALQRKLRRQQAALVEPQTALLDQHAALIEQAEVLEARNREIRSLATALTLAEQAERERIAMVLHDDLQQHLVALSMMLMMLRREASGERAETLGAGATEALNGALHLTRTLVSELSPTILQGEHVRGLLDWIAARNQEKYGIAISVEVRGDPHVPDRAHRVLLHRVLCEALLNVVKHSGGTEARLVCWGDGTDTFVRVEDDGTGFDVAAVSAAPVGFGLSSIRERLRLVGGRFEVDSAPGAGTRVTVGVPGAAEGPRARHGPREAAEDSMRLFFS